MALETFTNPRTRQEENIISGIVEAVYFNELKNIKTYTNNGRSWTPTHSVTLIIDGDRVQLGLTDKDVVRAKDLNGNYQDLVKGVEVTIPVNVGSYDGKPQYSGKVSETTIVDNSGAVEQVDTSKGGKQNFNNPKRMEGIAVGHAVNVAINVVGSLDNPEAIIEAAKEAHTLTNKIKEAFAKEHPDLAEYELGARVGQAILSSSHYVDSVQDIEELALQTLNVIIPEVEEFVKGGGEEDVKKAPTTKKTTSKKAVKKSPPKEEVEEQEPEFDEDDSPF